MRTASEKILGPSQLRRVNPNAKDPNRRSWTVVCAFILLTCILAYGLLWYINADRDIEMVVDVVTFK